MSKQAKKASRGSKFIPEGPTRRLIGSYSQDLALITEQLSKNGAVGLILIDASLLENIERSYGISAYRRATQELRSLILEISQQHLAADDLITAGDSGVDELAIFLFRPRTDCSFYHSELPKLAAIYSDHLLQRANRIVYPYQRDAPYLPVGTAIALHNPTLRETRQVRRALENARRDSDLNSRLEERRRYHRFAELVLSEDVTSLYEPIVNLTTREVLGYEALARGPRGSDVHSPNALFQMAHDTELVFELDCLCRRAALRGAHGLPAGKLLFLNILPTAIHDPNFRGDALRHTLEEMRLRPRDVVFEISEKESINNFAIFREARDYYSELGFKVALDDTGVAYGTLDKVMELSPDFIKIDLVLVRSIDTDPPRQELLRALHAVAGKLGAQIIAEGIETSEELATIQSLGIPYGQGFLFGRAAPLRRAV